MKKILLIVSAVVLASFSSFAQLSQRLQQAIDANDNQFHQVRIEFTDNVNCYALNHQFKENRVKVDDRPKLVITSLQQQAELSQEPVLQLLHGSLKSEVKNIYPFWIVNTIVLQASATAIEELAKVETVALIDIEDSDIIAHDPIIRGEESTERSPNGIESGLEAINAPAMWALGYTGRGRITYCYDTGVWPTHPAFAERFLGLRYPQSQCWTGFFSDVPNGNVSDHGTHVLGTMAGLVEETNDTIGVAFGAYWIANDFVTSTVAALPPLAAMMGAFEWALNPDGDIATTEDIPDVINNSWRWRDDPDTVQCAGLVVNLMNAVEAAGIANIFSGGNSGPSNSTVNAPQRINTSEVNTFSVGSVNANQPYPYPISNFSTRGPIQCPSGGNLSLEIHPEVVAPGQNVRSAWGTDEFNTISGTSMSSPHVSGAILLLKEAFPYLSGEDLMWALYLTAIDFGDPGEDNIYGMGLIDVHAAYLHLAQTNIPVDPTDVPWDLAITGALNPAPNGITCENTFSSEVTFKNLGTNTISSVDFDYSVGNSSPQSATWTGSLLAGESTTFTLPVAIIVTEFGNLSFDISASINGQPTEYDLYNNRWHMNFNRINSEILPFADDFNYGIDNSKWLLQNHDGSTTWDTISTQGLTWTGTSLSVQCYNYSPKDGQKDGLVSPELEIPTTAEPVWMLFDLAYQKRTNNVLSHDTLQVQVSTDCGATFSNVVYNKAGDDLSTNDTTQLNFMPETEWDWRRDSISLSAFSGQNILVRIESTNRKGNNIYIDNLKIFSGNSEPAFIPELDKSVRIYPNPTSSNLSIELDGKANEIVSLSIQDIQGKFISAPSFKNNLGFTIDTSSLVDGLYLVSIETSEGRVVKRFVKQ